MDDKRRIVLVETTTIDQTVPASSLPDKSVRYQYTNHLGSTCLELDENAALISYEEYYPYGSTSYQAGTSAAETSLKRYRFSGKERDEENGFYYHGARYYAPWLGRWTECDPAGLVDGPNLYAYVRANPIMATDPLGTDSSNVSEPKQPPPGFSTNEMAEQQTLELHYPDADPTNPKQEAVDFTRNAKSSVEFQIDRKTGEILRVDETRVGGEWIQLKRLKPSAETSVSTRVVANVNDAMDKFSETLAEAGSKWRDSNDGSQYRLTLSDPNAVTVHVEVPGFSSMTKVQQASLQHLASDTASAWQAHFENVTIAAQVTDIPTAVVPTAVPPASLKSTGAAPTPAPEEVAPTPPAEVAPTPPTADVPSSAPGTGEITSLAGGVAEEAGLMARVGGAATEGLAVLGLGIGGFVVGYDLGEKKFGRAILHAVEMVPILGPVVMVGDESYNHPEHQVAAPQIMGITGRSP
jgi:RHS repeat-associated protein